MGTGAVLITAVSDSVAWLKSRWALSTTFLGASMGSLPPIGAQEAERRGADQTASCFVSDTADSREDSGGKGGSQPYQKLLF